MPSADVSTYSHADPILAVVISDFGRDAALAFCANLARAERARIASRLPAGATFYDEYRRLTLALSGDLHFAKGPVLEGFRRRAALFDPRVLVGFEGGLALEAVVDRLGVLALEAMAGPVRRGIREVMVLLPCNTLAPASWALEQRFADPQGITEMVRQAGLPLDGELEALARRLAEEVEIIFPTVPGAVLAM